MEEYSVDTLIKEIHRSKNKIPIKEKELVP